MRDSGDRQIIILSDSCEGRFSGSTESPEGRNEEPRGPPVLNASLEYGASIRDSEIDGFDKEAYPENLFRRNANVIPTAQIPEYCGNQWQPPPTKVTTWSNLGD